jgi:hypothetical protein
MGTGRHHRVLEKLGIAKLYLYIIYNQNISYMAKIGFTGNIENENNKFYRKIQRNSW